MDGTGGDMIDLAQAPASADDAVEYSLSNCMVARLASLDVSIALCSHQSGRSLFPRPRSRGRPSASVRPAEADGDMRRRSGPADARVGRAGRAVRECACAKRAHQRRSSMLAMSRERCHLDRRSRSARHRRRRATIGRFSSTRGSIASRRCRRSTVSRRSGSRRSSPGCSTATNAISTGSPC